MSPSARALVKNSVLVLGSAGVVAIGWFALAGILRVDAFAKFQPTGDALGSEVGVSLRDFSMNAYSDGKLAATAQVDHVTVRRDRSVMEMTDVSHGRFETDSETGPLDFDMKSATYHYFQDRLDARDGAHVKGEDLDLLSDQFSYDKSTKTLQVRGKVNGELSGGDTVADDVTIRTDTKEVAANNVRWKGKVDLQERQAQRSEWVITGNLKIGPDGKTQTWTPGRATDGEIIVIADRVDYDRQTDVLVAKGNVRYFGADANLLSVEATVYRKEKRVVMTGSVRMVLKSEDDTKAVETEFPTIERITPESLKTNPQGATQEQVDVLRDNDNVRKYPIKVVADRVEYWYKDGEKRANITGSPFARQDLSEGWRHAWAFEAYYDGEAETLTLKSRPDQKDARMVLSIGDDYKGLEVTISTKEGDKSISGKGLTASLFIDDGETGRRSGGGGGG